MFVSIIAQNRAVPAVFKDSILLFNSAKNSILVIMADSPDSSTSCPLLLRQFLNGMPAKPLIAIVGPTGSGKTAFSIRLSHELESLGLHPEVVNADSRQFYRNLDVGTAKITPEEMEGVPHHLLSVLDPNEECSIAWFQREAGKVIADIHARGHIPLLVGGSMLYVSALIDAYEPVAAPDAELRERLSREYDQDAGETLVRRLAEVDPESAAAIPRENKVYVIRALEIWETTGKPKAEALKKGEGPYDLLMFGMQVDPEELKKRVTERAVAMLQGGWIEEVKLLREFGYGHDDPAMESHGYREILAALERGDVDREKLAKDIATKTRQYAKRSLTWWRRDSRIHWVTPPSIS